MFKEILNRSFFKKQKQCDIDKKAKILYRLDYKKAKITILDKESEIRKSYLLTIKEEKKGKEFFISKNCYAIQVFENNLDKVLKFTELSEKMDIVNKKKELLEKGYFELELSKRLEKIHLKDYIVKHYSEITNGIYFVHYKEKEFLNAYK